MATRRFLSGPTPPDDRPSIVRMLVVLALSLVGDRVVVGQGEPDTLAGLAARRRELNVSYGERIESLARKAEELELEPQAEITRRWLVRRDPRKSYFFVPSGNDPTRPASSAAPVLQQWHARLTRIRTEQAGSLFELAQQASAARHPALAYQLLNEVLREQPDHAAARRILDDSNAPGPGRGRGKAPQSSAPKAEHPQLGWRRGQYWRIESEHFRIFTNHSAAAGLDLARRFEEFHVVWRQLFFEAWSTPEALAARLAGRDEALGPRRVHDVVLFRSRDEYLEKLRPGEPKIDLTTGMYLDKQHTAYFYVADESVLAAWYHEAAHQLFQELLDAPDGAGSDANMWALEAAALYCESLAKHDGYCTLGGLDAPRLQFSRYYTLRGAFYLPLADLVALGRQKLQEHPDIRQLYSESAGLAHFFFDRPEGEDRAAFVRYVKAIYARRATAATLAELIGRPLSAVDQEYRKFLQVTDADLEALDPAPKLRQLSLGRTAVTDAGLARVAADASRLEWLDLSFTKLSDNGWEKFRGATRLKQLFLEQTALTDSALAQLAACRDLEELDLSGTQVTDAGLAHLAGLKKLRHLYLANCRVTDDGLAPLKGLKQLETVDLAGTQVTDAGKAELRRALPKWVGPK